MSNVAERNPTTPKHLKSFVLFFKRYMSTYAVVTAALPIPAAAFQLIPTYQVQTKQLSVYTSLFCFLILGFVFYSRHELARLMFPELFGKKYAQAHSIRFGPKMTFIIRSFLRAMPLSLIVLSIAFAFSYNYFLDKSISSVRLKIEAESGLSDLVQERSRAEARYKELVATRGASATKPDVQTEQGNLEVLKAKEEELRKKLAITGKSDEVLKTDRGLIPDGNLLMLLYIGLFVTAEACFVLMAVKEYAQDLLALDERTVITRGRIASA